MHFADVIFWTRDPQVYGHLLTLMHLKCTKQEENAVRIMHVDEYTYELWSEAE